MTGPQRDSSLRLALQPDLTDAVIIGLGSMIGAAAMPGSAIAASSAGRSTNTQTRCSISMR
jgi:hypothetical protein